ncbi:peptide synthase [Pseudomonas aeruginosa]|nr:peptide synthase [Pseudomonas aeruginosa]
MKAQLQFWRELLEGAPAELPCEHPQGALEQRFATSVQSRFDRSLTERLLKQAPAAYRTQVNDLLLTALARVVCRWSGASSSLVQLEGHGREELFADIDLSRTVGWFTSFVPGAPEPGRGSWRVPEGDQGTVACDSRQGPGLWLAALSGWRGKCPGPGGVAAGADHFQLPGPVRRSVRRDGSAGPGWRKRGGRDGPRRSAGQLAESQWPGVRR